MTASQAAKIRFILITGFLNTLGFGLIQPVMPSLLVELTGEPLVDAAFWGGMATFVYAIMQFICTPIIGALSDRYGRRPVLLVSLAAFALDMALLGLVSSLTMFILIRAFAGIFSATFATANAYIADITPAEERGGRFALFGAAFGLGFIFGPAFGGYLGSIDIRAPFFVAAVLAGLNALYGYFVATETLDLQNRRSFSWKRANTFGAVAAIARLPGTGILLIVSFLATLSTWSYVTVWSYVAIAKFSWNEAEVGTSIAYYGLIAFISQALLVPKMIKMMGVKQVIIVATFLEVVSLFGIGVSSTSIALYFFISFALITSAQSPALQQSLSSKVRADSQGELQGCMSVINSIAIIISPIFYPGLFNFFADPSNNLFFPGAPFVAASILSFFALILYLTHHGKTRSDFN